jgi:hypothetical protein
VKSLAQLAAIDGSRAITIIVPEHILPVLDILPKASKLQNTSKKRLEDTGIKSYLVEANVTASISILRTVLKSVFEFRLNMDVRKYPSASSRYLSQMLMEASESNHSN